MITADDVYTFFRPSPCRRRVYLWARRPELAAPPSEYDRLIMACGRAHEQAHLATFPDAVRPKYAPGDLRAGSEATRALIVQRSPVIYQGVLCAESVGMAGIPDFLIRKGDTYVIRDAKLAINLDNHREIPVQLSLYATAFRGAFGASPAELEVVLGNKTVVEVPETEVQEVVREVVMLKQSAQEPDEPVGWSKCAECAFREHCWSRAEAQCDPAVVYGVDQELRNTLLKAGVNTYQKLLSMRVDSLAGLKRPWGKGERRVGEKLAERIQRQVRVLISGKHEVLATPDVPAEAPCLYFDIEADPHDEGLENKVYLWGLLVERADGSLPEYFGTLSQEGEKGDRDGWVEFLNRTAPLLKELGNVPVVHYSHYERTWLKKYIERWGDSCDAGKGMLDLLWDMQGKTVQPAICFPIPSYGLKLVEQCAGFKRSQKNYGSLWSVVRYHEYLGAAGEGDRSRIAAELLRYNREDCEAMRHVLHWVRQVACA